MNNRIPVFFFLLTLLFFACNRTPSWVIPKEKMENILIDIHLAEGISGNDYNQFSNNENKQALLDAVYKKHEITRQQLDTSLVWYGAHLEDFVKMYDDIAHRLSVLDDTLRNELTAFNELQAKDVNVWHGETSRALYSFSHRNIFTFRIDSLYSDSASVSFSTGDTYVLKLALTGVTQTLQPELRFCVAGKDTVVSKNTLVNTDGDYIISLTLGSNQVPTSLSGSVYVYPYGVSDIAVFIRDISLYKYKQGVTLPVIQDTSRTQTPLEKSRLHLMKR